MGQGGLHWRRNKGVEGLEDGGHGDGEVSLRAFGVFFFLTRPFRAGSFFSFTCYSTVRISSEVTADGSGSVEEGGGDKSESTYARNQRIRQLDRPLGTHLAQRHARFMRPRFEGRTPRRARCRESSQ